ncbi:hypothetical protein DFJ77DRAFT_294261 [Powellomyces hirtus]|nr:hypothetical protein DFJ77DRAFT_294261 [Powellomyces hirtus]
MDTQVQGVVAGLFERTAALAKIAEQPPPKSSAPAGLAALFGGESDEMARHKREHYQQQQHRQAIVWLLQKRLLDASHVQKHMQERLLRQRLQKQETFLYSSAPATQPPRRPKPASTATPFLPFNLSLSALPSSLSASITSSALSLTSSGRGSARGNKPPSSLAYPPGKSDPMATSSAELLHQQQQQQHQLPPEEDVAAILTPREKMMLENANAEMLETLESSLDQVRRTTNVLQEISTLHGRLAYELQTQATTIDALYEEAWKTTDTVQRGNAQLVSAQRRFGAARIWVLLFLVTASVVLWFLDYYS